MKKIGYVNIDEESVNKLDRLLADNGITDPNENFG